ncbi:stalk domain-containing protein [Cohnella silvisoli]|uniref:Stalk domain-containing protein n=1 Tax=Cohnella silvisoli TaxID=2873699 RepID=A0ABV1KP75_9BACL|nr:stalk domain-containing protein [Cohnella silvisoli]MCD9025621.1 copper amine oxidase [Cohnella silvisoli]
MTNRLRKVLLASLGLTLVLSIPAVAFAAPDTNWTKSTKLYEVRTWTGKSELGHGNGSLSEATFFHPRSAVALPDGRLLVSDTANHLIRTVSVDKVEAYTGLDLGEDDANVPIGGYNDEVLAKAAFELPSGLAIDAQGNVYVADTKNNAVRKISKDGAVTTLAGNGNLGQADGVGAKATFYEPSDVAVDSKGNVYVADTLNNVIRKITSDGTVTTVTAASTRSIEYFPGAVDTAGDFNDGKIATAKFNEPSGLAVDAKGNLYVSDRGNQRVRYIDFAADKVTTVAGGGDLGKQAPYVEGGYVDGTAAQSRLNAPEGLTFTADGSLIVADSLNHVIRIVKDGKVSTLAGVPTEFGKENGVSGSAQFNHPTDVTVLADGRLVIVDEFGNKVRVLQKYAKPADLPTGKGISVLFNGTLVKSDVPAQLKSNAVLLPVNSVGTALGFKVSFDSKTGAALLTKGEAVYTIPQGSKTITKSLKGKNETLTLNAATIVVNNRLFIPVRFFASENDLDIQWDAAAQIVVIRNKVF